MRLDLRNDVKIHNRYELELLDAHSQKVKQHAYAENVVLNNLWLRLLGGYTSATLFSGVSMGTGTGTPAETDTALYTHAFTYTSTLTLVSRSEAYPTSAYVYRISIPASSSYIGALTEIGLVGYNGSSSYLWTHALLKDSEGNPITITKTDVDILTVTVTVYVTLGTSDSSFHWYTPGPSNAICYAFRSASAGSMPFTSNGKLCYCSTVTLGSNGCINSVSIPSGAALGTASYSSANRTYSFSTQRLDTTVGNTLYYNGLIARGPNNLYFGGVVFPDATTFPNYTISNMRVGTGDGTTTQFNIPIEYFIANTDVVKVNGTTLTRGTDYTIDNVNETLTFNDSMSLSNYLEIVSGADIPAGRDAEHLSGADCNNSWLPFTEQNTCNHVQSALKSDQPLIFKVSDRAPCDKINRLVARNLFYYRNAVYNTYVGSHTFTPYNSVLFYETRQPLTVPTLDTYEDVYSSTLIPSIIRTITSDPTAYCPVSTANTLVQLIHMELLQGRYNPDRLNLNIGVIQPVAYTIHYVWINFLLNNTKRLYCFTQGNVDPFANSCYVQSDGATYNATWEPGRSTITVDDVQWTYYCFGPSYTFDDLRPTPTTTNKYCIPAFTSGGTLFNGCAITLSGSSSASGPWTTIKTFDLSNLDPMPNSPWYDRPYGVLDESCDISETTYAYYKLELDVSNATNLGLYGENPVVNLALPVKHEASNDIVEPIATLALGYAGNGITFTNPPANGAVITLDAAIDRPFKNENFVLDASMSLLFGGA